MGRCIYITINSKALLAILVIAEVLSKKEVDIKANYQLIVNKIMREYVSKGEKLKRYQ